jgi:cytochrome b
MYKVKVWDLPTRLFHWLLVLTFITLYATAKTDNMQWHMQVGYFMLSLLLFRLVWGLVGGYWSRFIQFIYSPSSIIRYLKHQERPEHKALGHNPMGALSVGAVLFFLAFQVFSGLSSSDDIFFEGPLTQYLSGDWVEWLTDYHHDIGQILLLVLIGLHLCAIVYYQYKKHRLVQAMVNGYQESDSPQRESRDNALTRCFALLIFAGCITISYWVSQL